jgi:hypothetical protein
LYITGAIGNPKYGRFNVYQGDTLKNLEKDGSNIRWISSLYSDNNTLYIGGEFQSITDTNSRLNNFCSYDGINCNQVDSGFKIADYDGINAIVSNNGILYAGGNFTKAGKVKTTGIAYLDTFWHELDGGIKGTVNSLIIYKGELYAAGLFDTAGNILVKNITRIYLKSNAGVDKLKTNFVNVYPNPTKDQIFVDGVMPNSRFEILDAMGRIVHSGIMKGKMINIDQKPGIYFLRINQKGDIFQAKIIIE